MSTFSPSWHIPAVRLGSLGSLARSASMMMVVWESYTIVLVEETLMGKSQMAFLKNTKLVLIGVKFMIQYEKTE